MHCSEIVALVEGGKIEGFDRLGLPQSQNSYGVGAVTRNRRVVRDPAHTAGWHPTGTISAGGVNGVLGVSAKINLDGCGGACKFPRISGGQPFVSTLDLVAVTNLLVEDSVLVANAIANCWNIEGGE